MPSTRDFEVSVLGMTKSTHSPLHEYDIRINPSPPPSPTDKDSIAQADSAIPQDQNPASKKPVTTATCQCYIPSTPNQQFRIMVTNNSLIDACVSLFVDGGWVYSGLTYQPDHKVIYFSGKLVDENTIQEMRFEDLDTTCTTPPTFGRLVDGR
jgi:hypothetical protein